MRTVRTTLGAGLVLVCAWGSSGETQLLRLGSVGDALGSGR